MPSSFASRNKPSGVRLDSLVRSMARRRSLQDLDTWARRVGAVVPPLRDYREARAIAVTGSIAGLQSYAAHAVKQRARADEVWASLDRYASGEFGAAATVLRHMHPRRAQRLAWLMLQLHRDDQHLERVVALITWLTEQGGQRAITAQTRGVLVEALLLQGNNAEAREALAAGPVPHDLDERAHIDLANPYRTERDTSAGGGVEPWLGLFNAPLDAEGRAPIQLGDGATPYTALTADADAVPGDALVTVVVSSYQPDETLTHAVGSVLRSSWRKLEVLVVDDASGPAYSAVYDRVAALDKRVRVHTMETNGGTYAIRNWALTHSAGDYITFHDSDDWMHPERIAVQMEYLRGHPSAPGCVTRSLRVTDQLATVNSRSLGTKLCEPSLLFEREATVDRIGGFDAVRKGGDAEFRQRLEVDHGSPVPIVGKAPLTLQLISDTSLSGGDIRRYWVSLPRRVYRASYERWHARCRAEGLPLWIDPAPGGSRECYAPAEMCGDKDDAPVDVTVTADLLDTRRAAPARMALAEAKQALDVGKRVRVCHQPGQWHRGRMSVNLPGELISMLGTDSANIVLDASRQ